MALINTCYENIKKRSENWLRSKMAFIDQFRESYVPFFLISVKINTRN
jgi:hypothetical protein